MGAELDAFNSMNQYITVIASRRTMDSFVELHVCVLRNEPLAWILQYS